MTKKNTLVTLFDENKNQSLEVEAIKEKQAIHYLKSGNSKAFELNITPIDFMRSKEIYKDRFKKGLYDPILLKSEIAVLDAKTGASQWLIGERFFYIREHKIFKKDYGWSSFEEFIKEDTPYSKSTVYKYINIFENFTFNESIKAGSKLALFTQGLDLKDEKDRKDLLNKISKEDVSFREAASIINEVKKTRPVMDDEEKKEDLFFAESPVKTEEPDLSNMDIPAIKEGSSIESVVINDFHPTILTADKSNTGTIKIASADKKYTQERYPVIVPLENEILQKYYNNAIQHLSGQIKKRMEYELSLPENKGDWKKLKKLLSLQ